MSEKKPPKKIGLLPLCALVISSSIGGGVFGLPSDLARAAAPGPVIIAWLIVGFGILMLALSLNNLLLKEPKLEGMFSMRKRDSDRLQVLLVAGDTGCPPGLATWRLQP